MIKLEAQSTEYQNQMKKLSELTKKEHGARMTHFRAEEEVKFTEERYKAAQLNNLEETVKRAALIKVAQKEVQFTQTQFEQTMKSTEKIELKGQVVSALSSIPLTRGKMKQHNLLLKWIKQQCQEITGSCADTEEGGQSQSKRASLRALQNCPVIELSRLNKPLKANGCKQKQWMMRSILSPVDSMKVFKRHSKR